MSSLQIKAEILAGAPRAGDWQVLADEAAPAYRFLTCSWFDAWDKHLLPYENWRGPLRYLTAFGPGGALQAIVPIATQAQPGITVTSLGGLYWPFRAPLLSRFADAATCEALVEALTRARSPLAFRFGPVPANDPGVARLTAALGSRRWRLNRSVLGTTYAVDLPHTWAEMERRLGKSLRTNIEYCTRKLARVGTLEIRCIKGSGNPGWSKVVDDLGHVEQRSWQYREGGKLRFCGERNAAFWRELLVGSHFGQVAVAWVMFFNGEPVSFCFCLDCGDTRFILANNYSESMHRFSTGSVIYKHVFRDAIESPAIRRINIGLGDSGYKSRWSAEPAFELADWIAFCPDLRGGALELAWRLSRAISETRTPGRHAT
jgi:hypothetical protein